MDDQYPDLDKVLKQARIARKEDLELAESMVRLLKSNDFQLYLKLVLGKRIEGLASELLVPAGSLDGLVNTEYLKGAMFGFCLARDLPSVIVNAMSDIREAQENSNDDIQ